MKEVLYVRPTITQKSLPEVSEVPISVLLALAVLAESILLGLLYLFRMLRCG